ncbi:MAG TPA: hypothetical protein VN614_06570 [Rhodanobacter sp.]|nr:hypothetical protein [Rhodanobacter sp.]
MSARKPLTTLALCAALATPLALLPLPAAQAQVSIGVGISVGFAPPPLPVYVQPALPAPGYIWTPGYWAYDGDGYYWVPGAWVLPPAIGMLWTPGYWAYYDSYYRWHPGYWGPRVGFYGGVDYGYGYGGIGFVGGRWDNGRFAYNRAVVNFGRTHVTNVYNNTVIVRQNTIVNRTRVSYNGGPHGIRRQATGREIQLANEHRLPPTRNQDAMRRDASMDRGQRATVNRGRPEVAAATDRATYQRRVQTRDNAPPIHQAERTRPEQGYRDSTSQRPTGLVEGRPEQRYRGSPSQRPTSPTDDGPGRNYRSPMGDRPANVERPMRTGRTRSDARTGAPQYQQQRSYGNPRDRSNANPRPAGPRSNANPRSGGPQGNDRGHRRSRNDGQPSGG